MFNECVVNNKCWPRPMLQIDRFFMTLQTLPNTEHLSRLFCDLPCDLSRRNQTKYCSPICNSSSILTSQNEVKHQRRIHSIPARSVKEKLHIFAKKNAENVGMPFPASTFLQLCCCILGRNRQLISADDSFGIQ